MPAHREPPGGPRGQGHAFLTCLLWNPRLPGCWGAGNFTWDPVYWSQYCYRFRWKERLKAS